ncbi:MAG TPA: O-antigen ligase [Alcanivoracaceae bacterium]|nr:O-antigen ligase [Alcanivoracaceae bacterium]
MGTTTHSKMAYYVSLCVFLVGAISTWVPSGYSIGYILLFVASLPLLFMPSLRPALEKADRWFIAIFLLFATLWLADAVLLKGDSSSIEKSFRFLTSGTVFLLLLKHSWKKIFLWLGVVGGSIGALGQIFWERAIQGLDRADGIMNAIQFGGLSMLLAFLCLAGLGWAVTRERKGAWVFLLLLGFVAGVLASFWSGSRGAWLGIPVGLAILYYVYKPWLRGKYIYGGIALLVGLLAIMLMVPQVGVQERWNSAVEDVNIYMQDTSIQTSNGGRLELWKASYHMIIEHPWLGVGDTGFVETVDQLAEDGKVAAYITEFSHAHNEFLDVFAKRGIFAALSLLLLYLMPPLLFVRQLNTLNMEQRAYVAGGLMVSALVMTFGLTQAFMTGHNSGLMIFVAYNLIFYAAFKDSLEEAKGKKKEN